MKPLVVVAFVLAIAGFSTFGMATDPGPPARVFYNLDCSEFFVGTFGPPNPTTIDLFVDAHAAAGVTDLLINVNAQRTNYRSDVWEADWDGYDPTLGNDQPFFAGIKTERRFGPEAREGEMYKNLLALHLQGCDYPRAMLARAKQAQINAWLSIRMNDSHYPDQPDHPYHSTFWRSHTEWRLSAGANPAKGGWSIYGLDFEQPEVRTHYLKLVRELCERYDMDGLELDFMRFDIYFRPGRTHDGAKVMNVFIEQVRELTQAAANRRGHPVQLAVRVPTTPWIARQRGLDAIAWARSGWVDWIVAAPFWDSVNSDIPVEQWKGLLHGTDVRVAASLEDGINSGASGRRTMKLEEMRGILLSNLRRGADASYFFNLFTGPFTSYSSDDYNQLLRNAASQSELSKLSRRHPITITSPWDLGEPRPSAVLPYRGKHGVFRIHSGPVPDAGQKKWVELVAQDTPHPLDVRLNGVLCPAADGLAGVYAIPDNALADGYNLVEVRAPQETVLEWVEIKIE